MLQLEQLPGRVVVSSNIVATCVVEGASSAEARPDKPAMIEAPPGARLVTCKRAGYADYSKTVEVRGGKPSLVQAVLRESRGGEVRVEPKSGLEYVKMPAGSFNMGCVAGDSGCQPNEVVHRVTLNEFWIGKTPATQESYNKCSAAGACNAQPLTWDNDAKGCNSFNKRPNHPANCLNFDEAVQYCTWVGGRLPTSEEWEYTAKGGEDRIFP